MPGTRLVFGLAEGRTRAPGMTNGQTMAKSKKPKRTKQASLSSIPGTLVLVGAGKMGGAMLDGWLGLKLPPRKVVVIEPKPSKEIRALARRGVRINPKGKIDKVAALVIAVKPQVAADAVPQLAGMAGPKTVVVSIMAGKNLSFLQGALPDAGIVRAMPNTPAAIGRGITVAVPNARVGKAARKLADSLLAATGTVCWIDDESLMDAVTAVSGSGPAYVFLLAEAMTQAGVAAGLPKSLADQLARATVSGSGELLHRSPLDPGTLRTNVTSPGGTTAAALDVLMASDGLQPLLTRAVAAAARRGRELAG
jgi:pyrroline-5-carboxylate reductase